MTYHIMQCNILLECTHERNFDLAIAVIIRQVSLEDFVQALEEKRPKVVHRSVVL